MVLSEETRFQGCRVVPGTGDVKASPQTTQCPDPNLEIRRGGGLPKTFFWPFGPQFDLKIIGGGDRAPRAPPSATATFMGNGKEIEPKELRGCSIPHLLIAYRRHRDICDSPASKSNRL